MSKCLNKFDLGGDLHKLKHLTADSSGNNPKEMCMRMCVYYAMELLDENYELNVS